MLCNNNARVISRRKESEKEYKVLSFFLWQAISLEVESVSTEGPFI